MKNGPRKRYPQGLEDYELKQLRRTMTFAVRAIQGLVRCCRGTTWILKRRLWLYSERA